MKWVRDHSLSLTIGGIMFVQTLAVLWLGHEVWLEDRAHPNFWIWWSYEYNVSLVADVFGALLLVILTKQLREKDSAESK